MRAEMTRASVAAAQTLGRNSNQHFDQSDSCAGSVGLLSMFYLIEATCCNVLVSFGSFGHSFVQLNRSTWMCEMMWARTVTWSI